MSISSLYFITIAVLISPFECYHPHYRSKHHRRQSQQMPQNPQQISPAIQEIPQAPLLMPQQPNSQFPIAYPMYVSPPALGASPNGNGNLPNENPYVPAYVHLPTNAPFIPANFHVPYDNAGVQSAISPISPNNAANVEILSNRDAEFLGIESPSPENAAVRLKTDNFFPYSQSVISPAFSSVFSSEAQPAFVDFDNSFANYPGSASFMPPYSNSNPVNVGARRRRKNIEGDTDELMKLFEKGKKLLELSTVSDVSTQNVTEKYGTVSIEDDFEDDNTTLIPLDKGLQLKTDTRNDGSIVHAAVNISSSTQKIITYDNNTEVENVVEMEMEKKIEDEKGADKGYEEVRIVETERVKPLPKSKPSKDHGRKRKRHKSRFFTHHHRSKRSKVDSDEVPRSKFLYNKMAHRFLTAVKRKERVVKSDNLIKRRLIPDFLEINRKTTTEGTRQTNGDSTYDKKEIDEFVKFFLNEMKKFRKSRENKKGFSELLKRTCNECTDSKPLPHESKKLKKNLSYPEHMNVIMNLNMTWDSKMKDRVSKSVKIKKEYKTEDTLFENATTISTQFENQLKIKTPDYVDEKQNKRFFTAFLFFSVITCIFTIASIVLPKLYKLIRLNRTKAEMKTYKLYDDYPKNRATDAEKENMLVKDFHELEWQSENGDWLSEKEYELK